MTSKRTFVPERRSLCEQYEGERAHVAHLEKRLAGATGKSSEKLVEDIALAKARCAELEDNLVGDSESLAACTDVNAKYFAMRDNMVEDLTIKVAKLERESRRAALARDEYDWLRLGNGPASLERFARGCQLAKESEQELAVATTTSSTSLVEVLMRSA